MAYYRNGNRRRAGRSGGTAEGLAQGLGWFSIALGITEIVAPHRLAQWLGMQGSEPILRAYGLREVASGVGILASNNPAPWVWGRVGGDALDVATLATGLHRGNPRRDNVAIALAAVGAVSALDVYCAQALNAGSDEPRRLVDYSNRRGMPRPPEQMRGAAADFTAPDDMRIPEKLRPFAAA